MHFTLFSNASAVDFEHIIVGWFSVYGFSFMELDSSIPDYAESKFRDKSSSKQRT